MNMDPNEDPDIGAPGDYAGQPSGRGNQPAEEVDGIAQYDLDEDFPDYTNEQNRELNQIVSKPTI